MTWAHVLWGVLAFVWLADALRLRGRHAALRRLPPSDEPVDPAHRFLVAPGVELDDATRRAASAFARAEGLEVVDLVPGDLPAGRLLGLLQLVDPARFRKDRLAKGRTAGHAILVHEAVLAASRVEPPEGPRSFLKAAARLKQHACTSTDLAVAPGLRATKDDLRGRRAIVEALFGDLLLPVLGIQAVLLAAALAGPLVAPVAGGIALALFQLQPLLASAGLAVRPRDLLVATLLRAPAELAGAFVLALGGGKEPRADPVEAARPRWAELARDGTARFFEPPRDDCPLCGGKELATALATSDLLQHKPGRFRLSRCRACGHRFQNPRLSLEGLGYYYGDFYDGLGEDGLEAVFAYAPDPYLNRARMLRGAAEPRTWLDVGTGHGHFCSVAREVWPETRFEGLDLSESVEDAERRRWIAKAHRGLFPELAPRLAAAGARYDVVSMSHYLEHTREPKDELAAAAAVLPPGGHLFVEVPDPDSPLGSLLGRLWIPWFQPQHQHFVSRASMEQLLAATGFTPVAWHRGEAHQPVDLLFAGMLLLGWLSPQDAPWRPRRGLVGTLWNRLVWWGGAPLLGLAVLGDKLLAPFVRGAGWSNTYRVLARRNG